MAQTLILTPLYEPAENGWTDASIRELPAVVTLREYCLALQDEGEPLPLGAATVDDLIRGLA